MLGPFTFTFTLESEEFEKFEKVACAAADLYQTMITTRAPDGANNIDNTITDGGAKTQCNVTLIQGIFEILKT